MFCCAKQLALLASYASATPYTSLTVIYEGKPFFGFNGAKLVSNQTPMLFFLACWLANKESMSAIFWYGTELYLEDNLNRQGTNYNPTYKLKSENLVSIFSKLSFHLRENKQRILYEDQLKNNA
jgi:hypothetical protein